MANEGQKFLGCQKKKKKKLKKTNKQKRIWHNLYTDFSDICDILFTQKKKKKSYHKHK